MFLIEVVELGYSLFAVVMLTIMAVAIIGTILKIINDLTK